MLDLPHTNSYIFSFCKLRLWEVYVNVKCYNEFPKKVSSDPSKIIYHKC